MTFNMVKHFYLSNITRYYISQNFKMTAQWHIWELPSEDIGGAFNARALSTPEDEDMAAKMKAYLSLDDKGIPLVRSAFPPHLIEEPEDNWAVKDYVDIPAAPTRGSYSLSLK